MSKKDVIYIDIEDDITSIVEKVKASGGNIVALVPPKRSAVLQSAVNMKLLKKIGDDSGKKVVIISNESTLKPLAGGVGLFMADSLQSRPAIPEVEAAEIDTTIIEDDSQPTSSHGKAAVGAGAALGAAAAAGMVSADKAVEEDAVAAAVSKDKPSSSDKKLKPLKSSKSKIPNFQRFRLRMILIGGGIIALIVLWFVGFKILPNAQVNIKAQTTRVPTDASFSAITEVDTDIEKSVLNATAEQLSKPATVQIDTTGEKDVGAKASGVMTVQNCDSSTEITVPSGTSFTDSATGIVFKSNTNIKVPGGVFSGGGCTTPGEADVNVTSNQSGDDKNLSPRDYGVGGYSGTVTAFGGQMSGGTTKIVKVVSKSDVDKATVELLERSHDGEFEELKSEFSTDMQVINETFVVNNDQATADPAVGQESARVSVTVNFEYLLLGVSKDDINAFLESQQKQSLGDSDQSILDTGLDNSIMTVNEQITPTNMNISIKTDGFAGPEIDEEAIKEEIKGKRYSEAIEVIDSKEGVNAVDIELSPFWVSHVPTNTSKITIKIEVSDHTLQ